MKYERPVPKSRLQRLTHLGKLAGGLAGGMIGEGVRQLSKGNKPSMESILMTPANARRVADRLAEMRGAAMKVGQLLSMESGEFLPPELTEILSRLRKDAFKMPLGQVADVLNQAWGPGWEEKFSQFSFTPLAAASIGQVHKARLKSGETVAIKVQYPGVKKSIDSDVDNVATLLKMTSLLPKEIDLTSLLDEAKQQLHIEADYQKEAEYLKRFRQHLASDSRFEIPEIFDALTTPEVLTMEFMDGSPLENVASLAQGEKDRVAASLLDLSMMEIFHWGLLQSDPNFANYLYNPTTQKIQLLDFGATREIPEERQEHFQQLLLAAKKDDKHSILNAAQAVGYVESGDPLAYRNAILQLVTTACIPLKQAEAYDFANTDLASHIADITLDLRLKEKFGRLPPPDVLFLHRKLAGLYLLFTKLEARLGVKQQVQPYLQSGIA